MIIIPIRRIQCLLNSKYNTECACLMTSRTTQAFVPQLRNWLITECIGYLVSCGAVAFTGPNECKLCVVRSMHRNIKIQRSWRPNFMVFNILSSPWIQGMLEVSKLSFRTLTIYKSAFGLSMNCFCHPLFWNRVLKTHTSWYTYITSHAKFILTITLLCVEIQHPPSTDQNVRKQWG